MDKFLEGKTIKDIIIDALLTDGEHHKQWYLEQLLEALGHNLNDIKEELATPDENGDTYEWDEGIAP
jgi:hypothetical protein